MTSTTETISHILHGTVIDHIPPGKALALVRLLDLEQHKSRISIGIRLDSTLLGKKDLIKIEDRALTPDEANRVALLAPEATISIVADGKVTSKFRVSLPDRIGSPIRCKNSLCITNHEATPPLFHLKARTDFTAITCHYCRTSFTEVAIT